jgi:hypothetical protein
VMSWKRQAKLAIPETEMHGFSTNFNPVDRDPLREEKGHRRRMIFTDGHEVRGHEPVLIREKLHLKIMVDRYRPDTESGVK